MRSDLRGFVFGLSLGLAALCGFGAANLQQGAEVLRYQISAASAGNGSYRCYVVETATGKVWEHSGGKFTSVGSPTE